jgi:hypothetical protein
MLTTIKQLSKDIGTTIKIAFSYDLKLKWWNLCETKYNYNIAQLVQL